MADLKSNFAPMLTFASFDSSMDASGYYYHSSADSSPVMAHSQASSSFDSSPGQSPSQFYGSFEASASPQYYMESGLEQSQFQSQQALPPQQQTFFNNNSAGNLLLEQPQQQGLHIPGLNELTRLFQMANKVEDKLAIQSKINSLLFEHLPLKIQQKQTQQQQMLMQSQQEAQLMSSYMMDSNGHHQQNALITPPLSPNGDNMSMFMGKQNPMFAPLKGLQNCSSAAGRSSMMCNGQQQVVKLEPLSPSMQQSQGGRKISQSSFIEASNTADINSGLLLSGGEQSPVTAQNNYDAQAFTGQFNNNSCILVAESTSIPETVLPMDQAVSNQSNCADMKSIMSKGPKKGKGKGKGKKNSSVNGCDSRQSENVLGHPPKQSQKRTAHLSAEFRYRTKLNDKISKLRSLVGQKVHLSKSAVLTRSIERIVKLQKLTIRLHESNLRLQSLVAKYTNNNSPPSLQQNVSSPVSEKAPLMSLKELTRSLSVGSGTSLLSNRQQQMSCPSNQNTIDVDLAKFIDSQMQSMLTEPDQLPATIESTVSSTVPAEASSTTSNNQSLALNSTDEVFDFDQFLDQF